jgi:hypothetical protein
MGWTTRRGGDPDVLCAAALHGHSMVLKILVESVCIKFNAKLWKQGESAVSCACQNGHDEILDLLFELGARVNGAALPAAIRSGSFKCVEGLLKRKVKVDSQNVELATACGHTDVLGRIVRMCSDFGCSWMIAWSDSFRDGQRLLEAAGATPTWTKSGVKFLMRRPGSAAEFAGVVPLPETVVGEPEWSCRQSSRGFCEMEPRRPVYALVHALLERKWASPFAACRAAEFANLVFPPDVTSIGKPAFRGCLGLTHVQSPPNVITNDCCAFEDCSALTRVETPPNVTTIGDSAFEAVRV